MPALANTFMSTAAVGNREELDDVVSMLTPDDTPIYSMIGRTTFDSKHPEWETDTLAAPADNAQAEGDEYTFGAIVPPVRLGTWTQIFRKDFIISGTQEAVANAGSQEQVAKQKIKKGQEIKKDAELAIISNVGSAAGLTRRFGGIPTWLTSNVNRGAGGANGGYNPGTGLTVAATNGTQRAFTKALLDDVLQQGYVNGASLKIASVSPYVKRVFSTFMSDASVVPARQEVQGGKKNVLIASAEVYQGDFGVVAMLPNRVQAASAATARNAIFVDPDLVEWGWLKDRAIKEDKNVAKTGDAHKRVMLGEGALKIRNQAGLAIIADLYGMSVAA